MRIISFCAEGIEEAAKKGFYEWVVEQDADIICIQDLKAQEYDLRDDVFFPDGYFAYFFDCPDPKTNGVAIYCRHLPKAIMTGLGFGDDDREARYIQADYEDFSVGSILAPAADLSDPASLQHKESFYTQLKEHLIKISNKRRDYIICGNWQTAHRKRDVQNADEQQEASGFLQEERTWMDGLMNDAAYVDAFRLVNGDDDEFTFWPSEDRNQGGARYDMQLVSESLKPITDYGIIYKKQVFSRHAPIIMDYDFEL